MSVCYRKMYQRRYRTQGDIPGTLGELYYIGKVQGKYMSYWWNERPWRLIQTNMREIDMIDIDADTYVDQLKEFGATVVMINTGGILASFPSEVEDHTISRCLTGDSLKKIMDRCHEADIKVIARMDFSKARRSVYEKHPDWAYRTKKGNIIDYNGDVHMCPCGGFQQKKFLLMVYLLIWEVSSKKITVITIMTSAIAITANGYLENSMGWNFLTKKR